MIHPAENIHDGILKVIFAGDAETGKSAFSTQANYDQFLLFYSPTTGIDYVTKHILRTDTKTIKLNIYDFAGGKRYRDLVKTYYNDADVVCLMFNPFDRKTFESLATHLDNARRNNKNSNAQIFLVATHIDLDSTKDRQVKEVEVTEFIEKNSIDKYIETSAKENTNVDELLKMAADTCKVETKATNQKPTANSALNDLLILRNSIHNDPKKWSAVNTIYAYLAFHDYPRTAKEIKDWQENGEGKKALNILQGTSYFKTVQNIITCFIAGIFYPLTYKMFANNLENNGKSCLFWTNGDKQKAERAINLQLNELSNDI
jgi:small GTP-binding protein